MENNLFLTGEIQVGKSTLLRKLLQKSSLRPGGLETGFGPWRAEESRRLFLYPYGSPDYGEASAPAWARGERALTRRSSIPGGPPWSEPPRRTRRWR